MLILPNFCQSVFSQPFIVSLKTFYGFHVTSFTGEHGAWIQERRCKAGRVQQRRREKAKQTAHDPVEVRGRVSTPTLNTCASLLTPLRLHLLLLALRDVRGHYEREPSWGGPFIQIRGSSLRDTRSRWAFWFTCLAESAPTVRDCQSAVMMIKEAPRLASFRPRFFTFSSIWSLRAQKNVSGAILS